jgi:hypothetical protein
VPALEDIAVLVAAHDETEAFIEDDWLHLAKPFGMNVVGPAVAAALNLPGVGRSRPKLGERHDAESEVRC